MKDILEYVNANSGYVFVNKDKITSFVENISNWEYNYLFSDLKSILDEKQCIIFSFICESINFCFWGNNDDLNYKNYIGSETMFNNLKQNIKNNPLILDIENLNNLSLEDFEKLIGNDVIKFPLYETRFKLLKDTINIINNKKGNFFNELFEVKSDIELLNYITNHFWHFDDKSIYKNKTIKFNKRATLLVNDLYQLSDTIKTNISTLDNLMGCADYALPRMLYENGILIYSNELLKIIESKKLIEHDSEFEIEIRANTLYALELIKEELRRNNINLNSIQIDNIIWNMRTKLEHIIPVHRTITIYY